MYTSAQPATVVLGDGSRLIPAAWRDWPEPRPVAWHALASLERSTRFASVVPNTRDVVLLYHSVGGVSGTDYRWDLPVSVFRDQIAQLSARYELVDLETVATTSDSSRKRVAITFDDGFRNVYENALPVLDEFDAPATLFVCPAFLDGRNAEQLRRRHDLPSSAGTVAMGADQLRDVAETDRYSIGNHTRTHPDLATLPDREAIEAEVVGAREWLEDMLGVPVDCFSYPYGSYDDRVASVATESHEIVVTSEPRLVETGDRPTAIPRLDACLPAGTVGFEATDLSATLRNGIRTVGNYLS